MRTGKTDNTAGRACETVWVCKGSRIAKVADKARLDRVGEVKHESLSGIYRVGEELARSHLVFDVVRFAPSRRRQGAYHLTVGFRTAVHVHNCQKSPGVMVDVPGPYEEVGAAIGFLRLRHRRTGARSQEEQPDDMPERRPQAMRTGMSGAVTGSNAMRITQRERNTFRRRSTATREEPPDSYSIAEPPVGLTSRAWPRVNRYSSRPLSHGHEERVKASGKPRRSVWCAPTLRDRLLPSPHRLLALAKQSVVWR